MLFLLSHSVTSDSLWPYGLQHARLPCPSPTPRACSNSWPLSWWWYPTILSSVVPFSSYLHSFPASGPFLINQLFTSGGQSIELQHQSFQWIFREGRFPLGLTGLISLQSKSLLPYHGSKAPVLQRSPAQVGCMRQVLRPGALGRPSGIGRRGWWEGGSGWGIHVNPWLILVNVWQKPLQYCEVISLQLIIKK